MGFREEAEILEQVISIDRDGGMLDVRYRTNSPEDARKNLADCGGDEIWDLNTDEEVQ